MLTKKGASLLAGGVAVTALLAASAPSFAEAIPNTTVEKLVPTLGSEQATLDLPVANELDGVIKDKIDQSSVRVLASDASASYATALDRSGKEICIIVSLEGPGEVMGSSCTSKEKFARAGLKVFISGPEAGQESTAYLLPKDVDMSSLKKSEPPTKKIRSDGAEQLIVDPTGDALPASAELPGKNGKSPFLFTKLVKPSIDK
ncbi:hypothetical protein V6S67_19615 [Arthrobacter sp. Soc17.1.1.1]|uniref:hypothetical protein n=1 Tax=Arthrobacter sp. Soc17.1.1.1 TaxID=3121277 RepID=UPI002FE439F0